MAHGHAIADSRQIALVEDLMNKPQSRLPLHLPAAPVGGDDSGRFLTSVLECVQPQLRQRNGIFMPPHAEQPAIMSNG